ncbi:MAG: hypothetical protein ACI9BO_000126 [Zhongshania sp.]|jgi:hypothetical protein
MKQLSFSSASYKQAPEFNKETEMRFYVELYR